MYTHQGTHVTTNVHSPGAYSPTREYDDDYSLNAKDKEVELEIGDYATAVAVIEKGKKVFSITPSAKMKQLIKDDDQAANSAALMESDIKSAARSHIQVFTRTTPIEITNPFNHMD